MKGVSSSSFRGVCCPIHSSFSVFKKRRSFCSCDRKICPPPPPPASPSRSNPSLVWKGEEGRRDRPSFDQRILVSVGEPALGFLSFLSSAVGDDLGIVMSFFFFGPRVVIEKGRDNTPFLLMSRHREWKRYFSISALLLKL